VLQNRTGMKFIAGNIYHIYNQGNNNEQVFFEAVHYNYFLQLYQSYVTPHCETLCWTLMPNHFHFMIYTDDRCLHKKKQGGLVLDPITNGIRKLLSAYTHEFNIKKDRSGALFRPKTKAKNLTEESDHYRINQSDYYLSCFNYIHDNAKKAGLVVHNEDWNWSSYLSFKGLKENAFCNKELAFELCGLTPRSHNLV
jgi:putative transposase